MNTKTPESSILYSVTNQVAHIALNRPHKMNTFTQNTYAELARALRQAQSDDAVNVILLSARGEDFSAGNDIDEFANMDWSKVDVADPETPSTDIVLTLLSLDKPFIAAVRGRAIGFGATLLLHCDAVIASTSAQLRYPFADLGLVPEAGSSVLLAKRVGEATALRLFYDAEAISAERGLDLNLIAQIVDEVSLEQAATAYAEKLARKPTQALRATKRLVRAAATNLEEQVMNEFHAFAERLHSSETQAIFAAFLGGESTANS